MKILLSIIIILSTVCLKAGEIHDAATAGDLNKVKALLEADPTLLESKGEMGNTPLISACFVPPTFIPNKEVAYYLIDKGANINAKNDWGGTPLYCAIRDYELSKRLIDLGADVNAKAFGSITPLSQAANSGNVKITKLFIDNGAELNGRSETGTILHRIINSRSDSYVEVSKLLIEGGIKLQEFSFGNNELHLAAIQGLSDLVPILVKRGCNVNAVNDYGHTPLYYAAMHGYRETAEALIAAGADPGSIVEANYNNTSQLNEELKNGEAYLWYLGGSAPGTWYAVKTKNHLLVFDPPEFDESSGTGLLNGFINPKELKGQKITVFETLKKKYGLEWHVLPVTLLAEKIPDADIVVSFEPSADSLESADIHNYKLALPNENFSIDGIKVHTITATCKHHLSRYLNDKYGLAYVVESDGVKIFHAGLHSTDNDSTRLANYKKEIDFLKPYGPIDFAILPIGGHHMTVAYEHYLYLIDQLKPKAIYLIGSDWDTEENLKCTEVLKSKDVPVFYPDGGIAMGQRFHYRAHEITELYGDYLGQTPPGDTPEVFAPGIVSTIYMEHSAPTFSPDANEVFWFVRKGFISDPDLVVLPKTMKRIDDKWTKPMDSPYGGSPFFSPDGQRLYFSHLPTSDNHDGPYFVEKQGDGWSAPKNIGLVERFPEIKSVHNSTITCDGTLYFASDSAGLGMYKDHVIYKTKLVNGEYTKPELLPSCINLQISINYTPFIAPDESYLIFSSNRPGSLDNNGDLYITFHDIKKDTWSEPVNLGEPINTRSQECSPGVSPDGKYLFFTSPTKGQQADIFWVSTRIIKKLKN